VGVAGNILIAGTVHGICPVHGIIPVHSNSVCLQILNPFNVSGIDEATLFKFGKWVKYDRVSPGVKNFPLTWPF